MDSRDSQSENPDPAHAASTDGLTVSPALDVVLEASLVPKQNILIDRNVIRVCVIALILGGAAFVVSMILVSLIAFFTNLAFYGRISFESVGPAAAVGQLGLWVIPIPIVGALLVGMMARFGSKAIRGHGIPEAMEQVLTNRSRIATRVMFLKPISSAISIGTGGPFGAEGPIIATGGAIGSVIGQFLTTTAAERKILLAAGAAAGMAATFGSPVSAVLLAVELLLFEFRPRSLIPVALATTTATGLRLTYEGVEPVFAMPAVAAPTMSALAFYLILGGLMGLIAVLVTRIVYAIEDGFDHLPIHWMWRPALGAIAVGVVGYYAPDTLGVGYYNITDILSNALPLNIIAFLCLMKFISWSVSLGSGTSGGTLAPLFTIGGGIGAMIGILTASALPMLGIDVHLAALVGMAAIFSGASRAMLASALFAFETTRQPMALLPLLGGCATAYFAATLAMRNSIMTEKIARRGVQTPAEYAADPLDQILVRDMACKPVVALQAEMAIQEVREWIASGAEGSSHQGFPVLDERGVLIGVLTRRDILSGDPQHVRIRELIHERIHIVYDDCTVRQAADHMVNHGVGRLPVVTRINPPRVVGMISRSDVLDAYRHRIHENHPESPSVRFPSLRRRDRKSVSVESKADES